MDTSRGVAATPVSFARLAATAWEDGVAGGLKTGVRVVALAPTCVVIKLDFWGLKYHFFKFPFKKY